MKEWSVGDSAALPLRGVKGGLPPLKNQAGVSPLFKSSCEQGARGWVAFARSLRHEWLAPLANAFFPPTHALSGGIPPRSPPSSRGASPPTPPCLLGIFLIAASKP